MYSLVPFYHKHRFISNMTLGILFYTGLVRIHEIFFDKRFIRYNKKTMKLTPLSSHFDINQN